MKIKAITVSTHITAMTVGPKAVRIMVTGRQQFPWNRKLLEELTGANPRILDGKARNEEHNYEPTFSFQETLVQSLYVPDAQGMGRNHQPG